MTDLLSRGALLQLGWCRAVLSLTSSPRAFHGSLLRCVVEDRPSNLCVMPDILRTEWKGARNIRTFAVYLQHELGVMTEHPAVARSSAAAWMV